MLTVKHIETDGHESIREAVEVWFDPGDSSAGGYVEIRNANLNTSSSVPVITQTRTLYANIVGEDQPLAYSSGRVFIMNGAGQTVGHYVL